MVSSNSTNRNKPLAVDANVDRTERLEIYKLLVEMADRVSQRRQTANSFFLSINTFLITASAYVSTTMPSGWIIWITCVAGLSVSALWLGAIESYKSLNSHKFTVINEIELRLVEQPYSTEWSRINPAINGKKHRPFHSTERIIPFIFMGVFLLQALRAVPWSSVAKKVAQICAET